MTLLSWPRLSIATAAVACATIVVLASTLSAQQTAAPAQIPALLVSYPDWILTNGQILTVDKNFSIVQAIAIRDHRVLATGVDPGFASDLIPLALASTCQRIEQIKCFELADYATYDGA